MSDKYTVTLTREQLRVIQNACEECLRTRLGQFWQLSGFGLEKDYVLLKLGEEKKK